LTSSVGETDWDQTGLARAQNTKATMIRRMYLP
jgi:hypothetical protein